MATARATRLATPRTDARLRRERARTAMTPSRRQQAARAQFEEAHFESALDFVKATLRLAAPMFTAARVTPQPVAANRYFGDVQLVHSSRKRRAAAKTARRR